MQFFLHFGNIFLGSTALVLLRALIAARGAFDWRIWFGENQVRFVLCFSLDFVIGILLVTEGYQILQALEPFGIALTVAANSLIGFGIAGIALIAPRSPRKR